MNRAGALVAALLLVLACSEPDDAERRGDRAYAARDFATAYTAYAGAAEASAGADLLSKVGLAALRQGDAPGAVAAFRRLAATAPDRRVEAAEGLAAAARLAATQRNTETLDEAVKALRTADPGRPVGRWVIELARAGMLSDEELATLAPHAVAAAADPAAGDSLLLSWADALVRGADCAGAGSLYRATARRASEPGLAAVAQSGASACALVAARRALTARDTAGALDALGSVQRWAESDSGAAAAAALAAELREARLPPMDTTLLPMDTTFFMEDR